MAALSIDPAFAERNLNEGFSGGEKKRHEILQLELLNPKIAILDETDSGLDIDALKVVSEGVNRFREGSRPRVLLITHYTRILRYVKPDFVHVFVAGRIVEEGGPELAEALESEGYERFGGRTSSREGRRMTLDVAAIRADFPVLAGRCAAAGRWSTWTRARPRRSRPGPRRRAGASTSSTTPPRTGAPTCSARRRPTSTRAPAPRSPRSLARDPRRDRLHQERHRGDQPGRLLHEQRDRPTVPSAPATRSWSPSLSTTPTWCPGSSCAQRTGATLRWFRVTPEGGSTWTSTS